MISNTIKQMKPGSSFKPRKNNNSGSVHGGNGNKRLDGNIHHNSMKNSIVSNNTQPDYTQPAIVDNKQIVSARSPLVQNLSSFKGCHDSANKILAELKNAQTQMFLYAQLSLDDIENSPVDRSSYHTLSQIAIIMLSHFREIQEHWESFDKRFNEVYASITNSPYYLSALPPPVEGQFFTAAVTQRAPFQLANIAAQYRMMNSYHHQQQQQQHYGQQPYHQMTTPQVVQPAVTPQVVQPLVTPQTTTTPPQQQQTTTPSPPPQQQQTKP